MAAEIKRNMWSRFCKKFNVTNQYRHATMSVKHKGEKEIKVNQDTPFIGIAVAKKGRLIDGIEFFTAQYDPNKITKPVVTVKQPVKIILEKDSNQADNRLLVESKDGTVANIVLYGNKQPQQHRSLVEKLAFSMYEQRGYIDGRDVDDWLQAERKVKDIEIHLGQ